MAVEEHKRGIIKVEPQRNSSLVCSVAFDTSLNLDSLELVDVLLTITSNKHHDIAAKHDFFEHTCVVKIAHADACIKPILNVLLPSLHSFFIS